jgi:hypothetical protein
MAAAVAAQRRQQQLRRRRQVEALILQKIPSKMGVMWNLLITVAYDNIVMFLHTGFFVP